MSGSGLCALLQPVRVGFVTDAQGQMDFTRAHSCFQVRSSLKKLVHVPAIQWGSEPGYLDSVVSACAHYRVEVLEKRAFFQVEGIRAIRSTVGDPRLHSWAAGAHPRDSHPEHSAGIHLSQFEEEVRYVLLEGGNGGKSQLGRYWEDKFSSQRSSNEKKSTGRSLSGLCSLPCLLLALKAQWQVPETGHGPHRRNFAADVDVVFIRLSGAPDVENISSRGPLTKEFFTTFKSRTNNGDIAELYTTASWDDPVHNQDNTTESDKGILKELRKYYSWLYSEKPSLENEAPLKTLRDRPLQESDIKLMERPVTLYECRQAIHRLGLAKSAGPDGLPAEFYKSFEELVVRDLHNTLLEAHATGALPPTMREGDI
eukprot:scaffold14854_cov129-Isochrysis_galbana.AAC.12